MPEAPRSAGEATAGGGRYGATRADRGRATATTTCLGCGETVSPRLVRVFGDNDGTVHACPSCASFSDLTKGAGADPELGAGGEA